MEPDRWPAGVPTGATYKGESYADCDGSPSKDAVMADEGSTFSELCFEKRGKLEFYDSEKDPQHLNDLANNPEYKEEMETLHAQLFEYLNETDDPRMTAGPLDFDTYSYRVGEIKSSKKNKKSKK